MEGGKEEEEPRSPSGSGFGGKAPPARFPSLECISQLISHTIGLAWLGLTFSFLQADFILVSLEARERKTTNLPD